MMIGDQPPGRDCYRTLCICTPACFVPGGLAEWATDDQPDPGDLLLKVHPPHILTIGRTGQRWSGWMAMIDADHAPRLLQVNGQEFGGIKLKIDRRGKDIAQGRRFFNLPVPLLIDPAKQRPAGFDALLFVRVQQDGLPRGSAQQYLCSLFVSHSRSFSEWW